MTSPESRGRSVRARPGDEDRCPAVAVAVGLEVRPGREGTLARRAIVDEDEAGRCGDPGKGVSDQRTTLRKLPARSDHVVDRTTRIEGDRIAGPRLRGHELVVGVGRHRE